MKIEIDLSLLKDTKLSADEYIYLHVIYKKAFNYLEQVQSLLDPNRSLIEEVLQKEGWLVTGKTLMDYKVTNKFLDLFVGSIDVMFEELLSLYPFKVETERGSRVLRAKDPSAHSNSKAKKKYAKIVKGKPHLHRTILLSLEKQLTAEKHNLGYMQNLETWINNHTWEKYEDININISKDNGRITRKL